MPVEFSENISIGAWLPDDLVLFSEREGIFHFGRVRLFVRAVACKHLENILLPV